MSTLLSILGVIGEALVGIAIITAVVFGIFAFIVSQTYGRGP